MVMGGARQMQQENVTLGLGVVGRGPYSPSFAEYELHPRRSLGGRVSIVRDIQICSSSSSRLGRTVTSYYLSTVKSDYTTYTLHDE